MGSAHCLALCRVAAVGHVLPFAQRSQLLTLEPLVYPVGRSRALTQDWRSCSQALGDRPTDCTKARENDAALA
jgi:hypothetical protein